MTVPDTTPVNEATNPRAHRILYCLMLSYLVLDYVRPQDTIPILRLIRPAMVVTVALALTLLAKREHWLRGNGQQRAVWAFLVVLAVHVPLALNNRYAFQAWLGIALLMPFVLALPVAVTSTARLRHILGAAVLFMAYQALYAVFHGGKGTGSAFFDENDLALFVNSYLPIAYFGFTTARRVRSRLFFLVAVLLGIAGNVVAVSRGGFVGLVVVGFVTWLFSPRKLLSLVMVAIVAGGLFLWAGDAYWSEMATVTDAATGTGRERVESWKSGWHMFLANPMGVGGGNFAVRFQDYQTDYFSRGMWGRAAHSLWVTLLAEVGVVGTAIYLFLLVKNLLDCLRIRRDAGLIPGDDGIFLKGVAAAMLAAIAGFLASGTFLSVLYYPHYWYLTGFIVAARRLTQAASAARAQDPALPA